MLLNLFRKLLRVKFYDVLSLYITYILGSITLFIVNVKCDVHQGLTRVLHSYLSYILGSVMLLLTIDMPVCSIHIWVLCRLFKLSSTIMCTHGHSRDIFQGRSRE